MTFTDDDMKRLKEAKPFIELARDIEALLARLEAAECAVEASMCFPLENKMAYQFHATWKRAMEVWRKAAGK